MSESTLIQEILLLLPKNIFAILTGLLLGLFVGLEREWSNKPAGIRTFSLVSTVGVVFAILAIPELVVSGVAFILVLAALLGYAGLITEQEDTDEVGSYGLALTTSVSLLVTYSIGLLVGYGYYLESITIAVLSSALLALKKELHSFAWGLSKREVRSAIEFAIIAFVIYPILPTEPVDKYGVVDLRLVWMLVIAISSIGFINYILAKKYQGKSFLLTGFLGGLVNSTAVIISVSNRAKNNTNIRPLVIGSILLANAAMAIRNAAIVFVFNPTKILSILPLITITAVGLILTYHVSTRKDTTIENDLKSRSVYGTL
jgi:uncharacterized membrane protein (DUF4010 family)